ncbi:hypothetical protein HMPREF0183_1379 [Brevibacterium mcbrellneri ATCC 49030]|uniref:Uncharacterized protein n=1 Tax=Brevibacterium mcbrellneri ATCC 49030 TaxID=585530 RepID=D4YN69_9MICO|nr:DUF6882 domain-containing protein [Brevibacterium mcbrellneri]EFG47388.1 hypothetical protein HMPREF0183_1379 [Brevibacterium mcbrellneri ATCC 49030]
MKESPALTDLVVSGVFISTEAQWVFERTTANSEYDWNVDFSDAPLIALSGEHGFTGRPHMIGSTDSNYGSFRWGWSPDNDWKEPAIALSRKVREYGAEHQIPELTDPEFDTHDDQALRIVIAAKVITGHLFHVPLPVGPATAWLIVDAPQLQLGEPEIRPVVKALAAGLSVTDIRNHRTAIQEYGRLRGFHVVENGDGLRMLLKDGSADLTFDSLNRLTNCQVSQPLSDEAAEQLTAAGAAEPQLVRVEVEDAPPVEQSQAPTAEVAPQPEPSVTSGAEDSAEQVLPQTAAVEDETVGDVPVQEPAAEVVEEPAASVPTEPEVVEEPAVATAEPEPVAPREAEPAEQPAVKAEPAVKEEPAVQEEPAPEPEKPKKKKKGFFGRLFGR